MGEAVGASPSRARAWIASLVLIAVTVPLLWGGAVLIAAGGSVYYAAAGVTLGVVAWLTLRRDRRSLSLYGAFLAATLTWALYEVGLEGWQLVPRLVAPLGLGLFLWLVTGNTVKEGATSLGPKLAILLGAVVLGILSHQFQPTRSDPILEMGTGAPSGAVAAVADLDSAIGEWRHYGGDRASTRYSSIDQINTANVGKLKLAWTYRAGVLPNGNSGLEVTPLQVGGRLYLCTGYNDVIALDAVTGKEIWRHRPKVDLTNIGLATCRGVAWYRVPNAQGYCAERIITATVDARLLALDAATGQLCHGFGEGGQVSLLAGMGRVDKGNYYVTSAPAVVRGKVVVGGWVSDGEAWGESSGVVRAFDAVTGNLAWAWDMGRMDRAGLPPPGEEYTRSTPNSWAPMSADEDLGMVYVPTGNANPDYFGAPRRSFDDRYSSSVVALDAGTGRPRWSFQTTHHDLWDYDVASPPSLVDLTIAGNLRKALVQPTKRGEIFVLDRETGQPLRPVQERPVPTRGGVPEERIAPTQPFPTAMPSFRGKDLVEADMWGLTPLDQLWCRIQFKSARYDGPLTPPGRVPNIAYPGFVGGMNWGGVSIDLSNGLLVANTMRVPVTVQLVPREEADRLGIHLRGGPPGKHQVGWMVQAGTPYAARVNPFLSPLGVPCSAPPYGLVSAVDLASGKLVWSKPLGTSKDSGPLGLRSMLPIEMGVPNIGGSIATKGGLVFIAAATDRQLRALDVRTGRELWSAPLPTGGHATPMTFLGANGKQFVVIAAGGNRVLNSPPGDTLLAFSLPQ